MQTSFIKKIVTVAEWQAVMNDVEFIYIPVRIKNTGEIAAGLAS